ncbi:hypothetical protein GCM10010507_09700 [Streptomyces cinnamoneus]|uniref:Uncharacterized protein n=1 Tax=Streptomyces cinnamoneus TaxID=53446 RepID=A0A918WCW3_STRCJ|nr:hypothetical protein GCM10010507_09700 [Streptomyces cinnamoneus]
MSNEVALTDAVDAELLDSPPASGGVRFDAGRRARRPRQGVDEHIAAVRPRKTKVSCARDWTLWMEFRSWLAGQTGTGLRLFPLSGGGPGGVAGAPMTCGPYWGSWPGGGRGGALAAGTAVGGWCRAGRR